MQKYQLPRYIPVASELYDFLQENAMPRTLPDGRTESPGVFRIYISSLTILALFYACSAVVSLILRGVATILRAAGIMGMPRLPAGNNECIINGNDSNVLKLSLIARSCCHASAAE